MQAVELVQALVVFFVGFIAGVINTIAGGGSLLTLPLLIFLGLPSAVANGTNRVAILLQTAVAIREFSKKKLLNFSFGFFVAIPAIIGAIWGAHIAIRMEDELFNRILALVLIMCVGLTVLKPTPQEKGQSRNILRFILSFIAFLFVGFYGGFIQAGVGFLIIGALSLISGLDLVKANAIKVFVVFFFNVAALVLFIGEGKVHWPLAINMALGNMLGAKLGVYLTIKKGQKWIKAFLLVTVLLFAWKLLSQ